MGQKVMKYGIVLLLLTPLFSYSTSFHNEIYATIVKDSNERLRSFNNSWYFKKNDGEILACDKLIAIHVGTTRGNSSYGGICSYSVDSKVMVCDDDMVGHFKLDFISNDEFSLEELGKFVATKS